MAASSGRSSFFALEAGEYLQELGRALGQGERPEAATVRVARALRGASLLAGPAEFTRAAAALEAGVRAVADRHVPWEPGIGEVLRAAVETLTALLRQIAEWGPDPSARALALATELERHTREAGAPPPPPFGRRAADRSQPGVRAFLAREAAMVAGALERLAREPGGLDAPAAAESVLRTTRPLRGVAFLGEVPPLGELLDLTEQFLREPLTGGATSPRLPHALGALAAALARAAREITDGGTPSTDTAELAKTAAAARLAAADESDVLSIEALFADGDPRPVLQPGTPPASALPGPDAALPLLALAGRLSQAVDHLGTEAPLPLRSLRETGLLLVLRSGLPPRPALPVDRLLAASVRALGRGAAQADPPAFLVALRDAVAAITTLAEDGGTADAPGIAEVTARFESLPAAGEAAASGRDTLTAAEAAVPGREADTLPVVPIESLLAVDTPSPTRADAALARDEDVVPIESLAPDPAAPRLDPLESAVQAYQRLLGRIPEELLPATLPAPAPAAAAARAAMAPSVPGADEADVVPIESLLYRGRGALARAGDVRREIDEIVAAFRAERRLEPLIRELLDLIPLALDESA